MSGATRPDCTRPSGKSRVATNDYPIGACPQCCGGVAGCECGVMWKGTLVGVPGQCEGTRIDTACVREYCAEFIFDWSGLPGGGLQPSAWCADPSAHIPSSYMMPIKCSTTRGTTGSPIMVSDFPAGGTGSGGYVEVFLIIFENGQPTGGTGAYNSFHAYITVEGGVWEISSFQDSKGHTSPFRIVSCDPLLIEGKIVPWFSGAINFPAIYRTFGQPDRFAADVTPCSVGSTGATRIGEWFYMPSTVSVTVRITERTPGCVWGPTYGSPAAKWWCTPAGCVQASTRPVDATAGPFDSMVDCSAGCGTVVALKWYCTPAGCVEASTPPADATSGPHDTLQICQATCSQTPPTPDPYWCVSGTCVQSANQPPGGTGPFTTLANCVAGCAPAPTSKWWCIYGVLVKSVTSPHPDAAGPFNDAVSANCGPAEMVWHCAESGPARISKWDAVQHGWPYYQTEAETVAAGCVAKWYCTPDGCGRYTAPPAGVVSGPHATDAICRAICGGSPDPTAGWYCVGSTARGVVSFSCQYFSTLPPDGTVIASGPHANSQGCGLNCDTSTPDQPPIRITRSSVDIQRVTIPCVHLGDAIEDPATCGCGTAVLRKCAIYGQCRRTGYPKAGEPICLTCPSYQA